MAVKKKSFEESMKRLEEIVSQLERGESSLDQSLKLFEEGTGLAAHCTQMLDQAEPEGPPSAGWGGPGGGPLPGRRTKRWTMRHNMSRPARWWSRP